MEDEDAFDKAVEAQWKTQGEQNVMTRDHAILAASMFAMTLSEIRSELGLDPFKAEWNDVTDKVAELKAEVAKLKEKVAWESRSNKGMHPMDKYAVKKIRANIIAGNRDQAKGYYLLDDWVLKAIEEDQLFPEAQPEVCAKCKTGVIVSSISSCQSCWHCSNKECDQGGCNNLA